jgi:hypothetical protein
MKKIFLLLLFFLFSCSTDYSALHNEKDQFLEEDREISQNLEKFSYNNINYLS